MYCLSENENSCHSSKSRIAKIAKFQLLIESSGENLLLNERSKTLMLEIGNKYRLEENVKTEPFKRVHSVKRFANYANTVSRCNCENATSKTGDFSFISYLIVMADVRKNQDIGHDLFCFRLRRLASFTHLNTRFSDLITFISPG